ncbi:hypothetical protein PybrP1_002479 [[Pythium] brassicae (nom. inval.)]|nr:hypothetical protein PybrP1_002479 [[Pythium] brassicae (nom. inval.)]
MAACIAAVEAEEALLQIYALQLRAECRRVALDEEIDREQRELLREHEQLLRMREKQLAQQQYEDAFVLRAEVRKLRRQSDALQQRQESQTARTAAAASKAQAAAAEVVKRKASKVAAKESESGLVAAASVPTSVTERKRKKTKAPKDDAPKKSVVFTVSKPAEASAASNGTRARRLEESFDEEVAVATTTAADELLHMLSQDRTSDSESEQASLASLLPPALSTGASSPGRAKGTPSKFTPSKLARSVMKKAMAAPMDFDFTRKAALAKARAAAQQAAKDSSDAAENGEDADAPVEAETPSKKALKRRKDLGISFVDKPAVTTKPPPAAVASSSGPRSLMQMVGAVPVAVKPKEKGSKPVEPVKPAPFAKKQPQVDQTTAKPKNKKPVRTTESAAEPEAEDAIADKPTAKPKPAAAKKTPMEQAIANADLLTRVAKLQDIATPKVAGKKLKALSKPATTSLAVKRAEIQKLLGTGASSAAPEASSGVDDDAAEDNAVPFATPEKPRVTLKRKRADDAAAPAAPAPSQPAYLQSPSVTALLAMRPAKSPMGIRYVPKTLKTPQMVRKRARSGQDGSEPAAVGGSAWGSSSSSFFDKFSNEGALRLKRTARP